MNKYYLYKAADLNTQVNINLPNGYEYFVYRPRLFQLKLHEGNKYVFLFWYIFTFGKYFIVYVQHKNEIVHSSVCLPKFFKFPFMNAHDLEIGPCWTSPNHRGKALYPATLIFIIKEFSGIYSKLYIMSGINNIASQKGIEKAGFSLIGYVFKTKITGRYFFKSNI
ncbi:hypothetical protein ACE1ET_01850 [Saccharicrinis sp. FJH62]|uniref:hypothetical protein n=1 Tax=Saccharicrinis sp. FJH62 TaxID=3344657 RepID=UPI0035D4A62C